MDKNIHESVQEVGRDVPPSPLPPPRKRTVFEKLGQYNVWVLALGTIAILGSMAFLAFVWSISNKNTTVESLPPLWKAIVANGWTSRVLTLCTVLIRVALAAQLCVFAALIAALILERVGASHEDFPLLSMIRCANTGPTALLWNVLHTLFRGTQLRYSVIIIVTVLNALTLQFMSTILLADFGIKQVVLDGRTLAPNFYWGIDSTQNGTELANNFWAMGMNFYPAFAELKGSGSQGPAYSDAGSTYRGFLPFSNATLRENLMTYSGPMTVADERVVCVKPTLTNVVFEGTNNSNPGIDDWSVMGTMAFNGLHPDVQENQPQWMDFNCIVPWDYSNRTWWPVSVCQLGIGVGILSGGINPLNTNYSDRFGYDSTKSWLVLNTSYVETLEMYNFEADENGWVKIDLEQRESPEGPWSRVGTQGSDDITVDISLCLTNPKPDVYQVNVKNERDNQNDEIPITWDGKAERGDTTALRTQLSALSASELEIYTKGPNPDIRFPEDHKALHFEPIANWSAARTAIERNVSITEYQVMMDLSQYKYGLEYDGGENAVNSTFLMTPSVKGEWAVHRSLLWLGQDILQQTRDPALMMQALTHAVMQTAYYDLFNNFDLAGEEVHTETEPRYIPMIWTQFIVIAALLGVHFFLMLVALVWFLTRTELSLLGNAWQAVAQVVSDDTKEALHHGSMATDQELRQQAEDARRIRIARKDGGRLEAVTVRK